MMPMPDENVDQEQLPQRPYSTIVAGAGQPVQAAGAGMMPQYSAMTQQGPDVSVLHQPAQSPEELAQRKQDWQQIISHPNFLRAMGYMGASLAQPIPVGQTKMGHFANAFTVGQSAYDLGNYAQYEQDMKAKEEARKQAESTATVEGTQARTATERARLPGVQAESNVAVGTAKAKVEAANINVDKLREDLKNVKTEGQLKEIELKLQQRLAHIKESIPDAALRDAEMAKVEAASLAAREARARIGASEASAAASGAAARASNVKSEHDQITVDVLKKMPEQEQKEFLTKTGRYSTHVNSSTVARDMYGSLYDGLSKTAPNDPRIKGKTREQFVLDGLTSQKSLDASTSLKNYMAAISAANLDPDAEIVGALSEQIKAGAKARAPGSAPAGGSAGGPIQWKRGPDGKPVPVTQ